jgi:hypothetical protein
MRSSPVEKLIEALPEDVRDRVRERAAILWETGASEEAANEDAYEMETGRTLPGLARARPRASTPASGRRKTGSSDE